MKLIVLLLISASCFSQSYQFKKSLEVKKADTIQLTTWQLQQIELVEEEKKRLSERVNLMLQVVIDANGIELNDVQSINIQNGKLIVKRKED